MSNSFEADYPAIAEWVDSFGWLELGNDGQSDSLIRALDEGGLIWESKKKHKTLDEALRACEQALAEWIEENG
jgi:hypothetical protein